MEPNNTAVSNRARVGAGTTLGHFVVIEEDVIVGLNCSLGHHVVLRRGTILGNGVHVGDHTTIGKNPMKAANSAVTTGETPAPAQIADKVVIGTGAVIYAGCRVAPQVLIADLATLRENVSIGEKTIIGRGVAIENQCTIGRYCKLETNVYITAYSTLEDFVFVAPGVLTSNDNYSGRTKERFQHFRGVLVRKGGRLGVGSVILPGKTIEEDGFAAAGSVVTHDVSAGQIVSGVPASYHADVPDDQLLANQG